MCIQSLFSSCIFRIYFSTEHMSGFYLLTHLVLKISLVYFVHKLTNTFVTSHVGTFFDSSQRSYLNCMMMRLHCEPLKVSFICECKFVTSLYCKLIL